MLGEGDFCVGAIDFLTKLFSLPDSLIDLIVVGCVFFDNWHGVGFVVKFKQMRLVFLCCCCGDFDSLMIDL